MTTFSETTLPALIFSVPTGHPKGDVPALGRLTVNEAQAVNQAWLVWGMETNEAYTHTDSTGSGALFYEAEGRTLMSSSTVVTLSGSSPAGSVSNNAIESVALPTFDIPILSTQATGGGAHLTHVGEFRVFARVMNTAAATGNVTFHMEWAVGDFASYTRNEPITLASTVASTFSLVDLGIVSIPPAKTGAQRWEGRIIASADSGDTLRVDCIFLVPTDTASGEAAVTTQVPATTAPSVYDLFAQTAGALTGKTSSSGHVWTVVGVPDTTDWNVDATNHIATRSAVSDTSAGGAFNTGRLISAGTGTFTTLTASVDINFSAVLIAGSILEAGLAFRITDLSNYMRVAVSSPSTGPIMRAQRVVGASVASLASPVALSAFAASTWYTLTVAVDTGGRLRAWWNPRGAALGSTIFDFTNSLLATGGTLATGKVGLWDMNETAIACDRSVDNFAVTAPAAVQDAVMFASQSAEIRHDGVIREDSSGTFWQPVSDYAGDLLRVPTTSREQRAVRFIVKASRNIPSVGADAGIDDINATLALTPRYLSVPAPT